MAKIMDSTSERKKEPAIRRLFEAITFLSVTLISANFCSLHFR